MVHPAFDARANAILVAVDPHHLSSAHEIGCCAQLVASRLKIDGNALALGMDGGAAA